MTDGELWHEQRSFALRHMRQLGFGKTPMENLIISELKVCFYININEVRCMLNNFQMYSQKKYNKYAFIRFFGILNG